MGRTSAPRLLLLHGLRLKGFASAEVLADFLALDEPSVVEMLDKLHADGHVVHREGRLTGYSLTADGRAEHQALLAAELDEAAAREAIEEAYARFLELNPALLAVCTRWQLRDVDAGVINDHSDPAYDAAVVAELQALDNSVEPVCHDLSANLDRYAGYRPRLRGALERLCAGEVEYFTKPIIDSYHTVWFELHEDLLATLGIERAAEGAS